MNRLVVILTLFTSSLFAQQIIDVKSATESMINNVDTSYIDSEGFRWQEFSLPILRAYSIMDAFEADTTCNCDLIKGNKNYMSYLKEKKYKLSRKFDRNVIGHLSCNLKDYQITMWMFKDNAFGVITTPTFLE